MKHDASCPISLACNLICKSTSVISASSLGSTNPSGLIAQNNRLDSHAKSIATLLQVTGHCIKQRLVRELDLPPRGISQQLAAGSLRTELEPGGFPCVASVRQLVIFIILPDHDRGQAGAEVFKSLCEGRVLCGHLRGAPVDEGDSIE